MELLSGLGGGVAPGRYSRDGLSEWTPPLARKLSSPWAGAWLLQKCWWQLFLTGDRCFDVEPLALGVAFALEVDALKGES